VAVEIPLLYSTTACGTTALTALDECIVPGNRAAALQTSSQPHRKTYITCTTQSGLSLVRTNPPKYCCIETMPFSHLGNQITPLNLVEQALVTFPQLRTWSCWKRLDTAPLLCLQLLRRSYLHGRRSQVSPYERRFCYPRWLDSR
jgi:hypothetical protein